MAAAFQAVQKAVEERQGIEVTQADIDRARKGIVH